MNSKTFPIQSSEIDGELRQTPWDLIQSHEHQADLNHGQSLDQLAYRCGLSACEAMAFLNDKKYWEQWPSGGRGHEQEAAEMLEALVAEFQSLVETK